MKQILIETENFEINEINENENNNESDLSENFDTSDISETYTEILKQTNNLKLEINTNNVNKPGTSRVKTPDNSPRRNPRVTTPIYYTESYENSDRTNAIWNSRLNSKWKS